MHIHTDFQHKVAFVHHLSKEAIMAHQITISWDASPPPVSGYNIRRGTAHGNEGSVPINAVPVAGTSFTDNAVYPGQVYSYAVSAVFNGVESLESIDIVTAPVPFPPAPAGLNLGSAASFAILGGSTVTNVSGTGTLASGDVGVSPGTSITGFGAPAAISGVFHPGDFVSAAAQTALAQAFAAGMAAPGGVTLLGDIGGERLPPGVYVASSSLGITGALVLDASGDPNAVWIFQIGSTLTTATGNSSVVLVGGAEAANVYWLVGSSATLGSNTSFAGNILASSSITTVSGASVNGRLLAHTGAVTLDDNEIIIFQACNLNPLPPSPPNVPPAPPAAPGNLHVTSET